MTNRLEIYSGSPPRHPMDKPKGKLVSVNFMPDLWSKKILNKFYNEMGPAPGNFFSRSVWMKGLTSEIKKLSEAGLTSEQIAEKIDPKMCNPQEDLMNRWADQAAMSMRKQTDLKIMNTYGVKVIKPAIGVLISNVR